ncbi:nacht and ankyrin protein [Fusarium austroafricanum]|uniref:Nacht and ankyrin protein n=1 Tax=Fusarium austroafricanum TaxID=2364996 RepID=A0A8H4NKT7_9HYPO|nr:nacht and ankyrin protein [Fusarium austroafricanum]
MPGKQIEGLFRRSSSLVPTPSLFDTLIILFGLSGPDIHIFNHDRISAYEASIGFYTDHPDVSRRIMEHQRQDFAHYLQGRNLVFVMERFKKNLASELSAASEDFWNFYKAFPNISKGLPRWLVPSSYQARDEMHKSFDRWRTWCSENYNWDNDELCDAEYEPIWGTQYVRKMIQRHEALGLSDNGVAVVMLGYFFVAMANTVPAALWMIVHTLLDAKVGEQPDIKVLMKDPLLNSIYYETLRLRVAGTVGRTSLDDQLRLAGGWKVKAGVPVMFTGWLAGLDESCWNTGQDLSGNKPQHPLEAFWAERFLECPGSSSISGPAKKKRVQPARESPQRPTTHMGTEDARSKASVAGLRGHFFPFGGGAFRCPGETLAKQVIFASVAIVLQSYDLRLIDPDEARKIEPSHRELPFGLHSFDRPVPVETEQKSKTAIWVQAACAKLT